MKTTDCEAVNGNPIINGTISTALGYFETTFSGSTTLSGNTLNAVVTVDNSSNPAGTTWFNVTSVATYGGGSQKAFPGGSYSAVVVAECIAQ